MHGTKVARWRHLAALFANRFNEKMLKGFELKELQGDEIRTFVNTKKKPVWIFTMLEVWSRLWISCVIGRRSYRNVKQVIGIAIQRGEYKERFLFTTDGFEPYAWAVKGMLSVICIYAQVMKKRRKDRVIHVDRNLIVGTRDQLEETLFNSEDSSTINTSFIERHNLTIRQGSSYLCRKTACHSREQERLDENMFLLMCYYNFIRSHMALKFGKEIRTPAMQAGLASKKLIFRDLFTSREALILFVIIVVLVWCVKWIRKAEMSTLTTVA